jgi:hypothetical protein
VRVAVASEVENDNKGNKKPQQQQLNSTRKPTWHTSLLLFPFFPIILFQVPPATPDIHAHDRAFSCWLFSHACLVM